MSVPLIGISESIQKIRDLIDHVADTSLNTVITGESGVGKEVVAQNLYHRSPRCGNSFIKINCAALPEGLLESELFGFEKGAFTGADQRTRGKFALANDGVLFLDEIGDMSLRLQAKLLHVLQSGEFSPLGSEKDYRSNAWVIAATNQKLEDSVKNKAFREDLYYRLNIIKIEIPPLRTRQEDISPLINHYLDQYSKKFEARQLEKPDARIIEKLVQYPWPGNVRELQNTLKRYVVIGNWDEVIDGLGVELSSDSPATSTDAGNLSAGMDRRAILEYLLNTNGTGVSLESMSLKEAKRRILDQVEKEIITEVLMKTGWNRSKAVKILKVSYKTLLYKISNLGITPPSDGVAS